MHIYTILTLSFLMTTMALGCDSGPTEPESDDTFGEEVEEAAEDTGDAVDEAAEDTGDAVDEAADDTDEAIDEME